MSTIVIRSLELLLVSCSPLGAIHILDTLTAVLTMVVSIVAVQVRLTGVPSYSVVVLEGVMVRVSWGGGTDLQKVIHCQQCILVTYFVSEELLS